MSSLPFSVLCYPCLYRSLLPHNVISPFLCPLLSLSIPLLVAPQCHLSLSLSFAILVYTAPCCPTMSSLPFSVLCYPCLYRSLLPHNVISPFLCPLLSLSIPLLVAPQCHLSNDVLVFQLILHPLSATNCPSTIFHSGDVSSSFSFRTGYVLACVCHSGSLPNDCRERGRDREKTERDVCWLVGCLTSHQQASVSQGRICSDNLTCCHTEIEVADQTFYLPH